jgi:hypothetical protein
LTSVVESAASLLEEVTAPEAAVPVMLALEAALQEEAEEVDDWLAAGKSA